MILAIQISFFIPPFSASPSLLYIFAWDSCHIWKKKAPVDTGLLSWSSVLKENHILLLPGGLPQTQSPKASFLEAAWWRIHKKLPLLLLLLLLLCCLLPAAALLLLRMRMMWMIWRERRMNEKLSCRYLWNSDTFYWKLQKGGTFKIFRTAKFFVGFSTFLM